MTPKDYAEPDMIPASAARDLIISIAKGMKLAGVTQFDCMTIVSMTAGCCAAWNDMLDAVGTDREIAAAQAVLAVCGGHVD